MNKTNYQSINKDAENVSHASQINIQKCQDENQEKSLSNFEAMAHLVKGNVGIGILSLPFAFQYAGLIGGSLGLITIGIVCTYCGTLLLRSSTKCAELRGDVQYLDYGTTAQTAFIEAGGYCRNWSTAIKNLVNSLLCANQIGFNAVSIVFMAENIRPIIIQCVGSMLEDYDYRLYIAMALPFILGFSFVRNLKYLLPFSALANIMQLGVVGILFVYFFLNKINTITEKELPWFGEPNQLALFFGMAIFSFDGVTVILPVQNGMKFPNDMLGMTGVLNISMGGVCLLYTTFGFLGYLVYVEDIEATIVSNLPADAPMTKLILGSYSIAIIFTYALRFYVIMEVIEEHCLDKDTAWAERAQIMIRISLTLFTLALSAFVPYLELFVALVGSVTVSSLGIIFPCIIDTAVNWNDLGRLNWKAFRNGTIFAFGLIGCLAGAILSLSQIIEKTLVHFQ